MVKPKFGRVSMLIRLLVTPHLASKLAKTTGCVEK